MKRVSIISVLSISLLLATKSYASECREMVAELVAMKRAQQVMLETLSSNHELFAVTLESYSDALGQSQGKVHKVLSGNMNDAAKSFRQRGSSAKVSAQKLDRATADLVSRLQKCLK